MPANRIRQVNSELQRELAARISQLKDPRVSTNFVSVLRVDTSKDLASCKVFISALKNESEVIKGLKSAAGFLRHEIGRALALRHMPELRFVLDESIKHGFDVYSVLEKFGDDK